MCYHAGSQVVKRPNWEVIELQLLPTSHQFGGGDEGNGNHPCRERGAGEATSTIVHFVASRCNTRCYQIGKNQQTWIPSRSNIGKHVIPWCHAHKDQNGTNIPNRIASFSNLIRSNSYFFVRFFRFRFLFYIFHISNVKLENGLDIFWPFSTFLLLIWNILNSKFGLNQI